MLKSCSHCGGIHPKGYKCAFILKIEKRSAKSDKFRNTQTWRHKSKGIKERDSMMCQICVRELYNTIIKYNSNHISTHHIIPIKEAWERRLDNYNLITLCSYHHELAEKSEINKLELFAIAKEQEDKANSSTPRYVEFNHNKC